MQRDEGIGGHLQTKRNSPYSNRSGGSQLLDSAENTFHWVYTPMNCAGR